MGADEATGVSGADAPGAASASASSWRMTSACSAPDAATIAAMADDMAKEIAELEARVDGWKAEALALMEKLP